jgi:hypothetical protein
MINDIGVSNRCDHRILEIGKYLPLVYQFTIAFYPLPYHSNVYPSQSHFLGVLICHDNSYHTIYLWIKWDYI